MKRPLALASVVIASCYGASARTPTIVARPATATPIVALAAAQASEVDPFAAVDAAVRLAIEESKMPGAVVVIGRHDEVLMRRAYGSRAVQPERTPMTMDTVFDVASLTKPLATATSVMLLVERGKISLDSPAAKYVPELAKLPPFTVEQLLLHTSGLPSVTTRDDYAHGIEETMRRLGARTLAAQPGEKFVYSDTGFIVLAEIVRRVSGDDLATFAAREIYAPLGMSDTGFRPSAQLRTRAAPTEERDGAWMVGDVHDPLAWLLGGVAGNAGLFSTADDLARFARAMLGRGALDGKRIFSEATAKLFFARHDTPRGGRTLGWDMDSPYATNRARELSPRAFGHGGYTGTALWIDPDKDLFIVFLSNRVHPDGKGAVNPLVTELGSLAVAAIETRTGLDVLRSEHFERIKGARVGLITNASARAKDGTRTVDAFRDALDVKLACLFSPEHGLGVDRDSKVSDSDVAGIPVHSLYGERLAPAPEWLDGLDALVFDLQDAGVRFYTYASTMRRAMKAAFDKHVRFVVLDRPNPLGGVDVQGPVFSGTPSFVNHGALPIRHGMTMGELAKLFAFEDHTAAEVVRMEHWRRKDYFDATGLVWVSPSPNLRTVSEVLLYPALGLLEGTNLSVGRGTDAPFEQLGAPWMDGEAMSRAIVATLSGSGVELSPTTFTPNSSTYHNEKCGGVRFTVVDRARFDPVRTGLTIALALHAKYPSDWKLDKLDTILGSKATLDAIRAGRHADDIILSWNADLAAFRAKRQAFLLYP